MSQESNSGSGFSSSILLIAFVCSSLFWLGSCKDKLDTLELNYQYAYAPVDSGHYVIYDVDSIVYSNNGKQNNDTVHYQLKELVSDTFYDNLNLLNHRLDLYRRDDSTADWVFNKRWSVRRDTTRFLKKEDDIEFVKLVFPPHTADAWNGNEYVAGGYTMFNGWNYYYTVVDTPVTIGNLNFPHALVVSEVDNENVIDKILRKEVYAKDVGMIYQEWESLHTQDIVHGWSAPQEGFRIRMRVRGYYP